MYVANIAKHDESIDIGIGIGTLFTQSNGFVLSIPIITIVNNPGD